MTNKVWEVMNELELVTSKVCSAREILDCATDAIQEHQYEKAESLISAAYEFLGYYLDEFDSKFKDAWQETVVANNNRKVSAWKDWEEHYYPEEVKDDGMRPWGHSDLEYLVANSKQDKVKKWVLPVEVDGLTGDCFISLPDDLLEVANLQEGDTVEFFDNGDGSFEFRKVAQDNC